MYSTVRFAKNDQLKLRPKIHESICLFLCINHKHFYKKKIHLEDQGLIHVSVYDICSFLLPESQDRILKNILYLAIYISRLCCL